jgi:predicted house-cleaning noncanonical NTP pyrophosphatase (MazG superfamily)
LIDKPLITASWETNRSEWSAAEAGGKACGLLSLPRVWTPPFIVFGLPFFHRCRTDGAKQALHNLLEVDRDRVRLVLEEACQSLGKVIVRSNGFDEARPESRGRHISVNADAHDPALAGAITRVVDNADAPMCVLVHVLARRSAWGHLSNERRVSRRRSAWLVEEHGAGLDPTRRMIAARPSPTEPLDTAHRAQMLDRLRQVAAHLTDHRHLMHCEWVWDERRVWIVQADRITPAPGEANRYMRARATPSGDGVQVRLLHSPTSEDTRRWHKLAKRTVMQELGMPVAPVYLLSGETCSDLALHGKAFDEDFAALSLGGRIPVVLRCDLLAGTDDSGLSLPTSEPLLDAAHARAFIADTAQCFSAAGIAPSGWAVLPAQLVPTYASVMALARPGAQTIRLDALWGFPDGVGCLAHDSYQYRIDREDFSEACRYKGSCLLYEPDRGWRFATVGEPYDWGHILNRAEVHTAASWSRRIADHLQREVQLMVLCRIGGARGATAMKPWHYTDHVVPPWTHPVRWAPEQSAAMVQGPADLERLRDSHTAISGIHFVPFVEERRDTRLIHDVATLAAEVGVPVYFSGSVLGHTYYLLRSAGANVVLVGGEAPEAKPDQYDKLVRDRIPDVVRSSGTTAHVVRATPEQGVRLLKHKLVEEALEVWNAQGDAVRDELADLLEALEELYRRLGLTRAEVEDTQRAKRASRGGFEQLIYLEATAPQHGRLEESGLFPTSPEPIVSAARRVLGPVSVERADGRVLVLRVPVAPPLRAGVPIREYGIDLAEARIRFRHDGLNLRISVERIEQPNPPGQLSLPIEMS